MTDEPLRKTVIRARTLLVHVERHLDRASDEESLEELGRAWIRAVQMERLLAAALPPDVGADPDSALRRETRSDRDE